MAFSRASYAARLLRNAGQSQLNIALPSRRFESSLTSASGVSLDVVPNQPDYQVPADKATSTFTPVPNRVQDGSEDILPAAVLSGAPMELQARTVRIYKESKPATQSGDFRTERWRMDWDILPKGHRWENPLMGWQSSGDFMQGTHVNFKSKEDAIYFAEKQGYEYFVQEPNSRKFSPKAYANNFLYSPKKLKHIRTK
ncbi:NADH:ubiquinone oxidoreductase 21kD subunit [Epichloe bromicola]|uniref:NADH dehydrogenase [ubiquinone] iron-sulfur protein 4, mitochondrial n=1 Tax=Epichloe bromicola TaxID=79588 RepID=A0ABQ0CIZ6_9HYPO